MHRFFDNVRVLTDTLGEGTLTLGAAFAGNFLTPAQAGAQNGATPVYRIDEGNDFELSWGVYNSGTGELTRNVIVSKIGGVVGLNKMNLGGQASVRFVGDASAFDRPVEAKAANFTAGVMDRGKVFVGTAAHTMALEAAATLGNGWFCHVVARGGDVVIDPNGAEQVEGANTFTVRNGGDAILRCDGAAFSVEGAGRARGDIENLGLEVTAAANALTIAMKGADGADPSPANPVHIPFANTVGTTGTPTRRTIAAANSLVIPTGATLGVGSAEAFRVWVVAFDDNGVVRLGAIVCSTSAGDHFPLHDDVPESGTLVDAAADSAGVFYTGAAVAAKPYRILGYAEWGAAGLVTAGEWTTTNLTHVRLFGPGAARPGQVVQTQRSENGPNFGTSSTTPVVATGSTLAITPQSAANLLRVQVAGQLAVDVAGEVAVTQVSRGVVDNAGLFGSAGSVVGLQSTVAATVLMRGVDKPNTGNPVTYAVQLSSIVGGGVTWSPGGNIAFDVEEIMG